MKTQKYTRPLIVLKHLFMNQHIASLEIRQNCKNFWRILTLCVRMN